MMNFGTSIKEMRQNFRGGCGGEENGLQGEKWRWLREAAGGSGGFFIVAARLTRLAKLSLSL